MERPKNALLAVVVTVLFFGSMVFFTINRQKNPGLKGLRLLNACEANNTDELRQLQCEAVEANLIRAGAVLVNDNPDFTYTTNFEWGTAGIAQTLTFIVQLQDIISVKSTVEEPPVPGLNLKQADIEQRVNRNPQIQMAQSVVEEALREVDWKLKSRRVLPPRMRK